MVVDGRCCSQLADDIALVNYCSFSSEMLNRTSCQICGRWYLPMFLLRDGSLTMIYRASLMVLVRFWSSLPTMSKFLILILSPVVYSGQILGMGPFDVTRLMCLPWQTGLQCQQSCTIGLAHSGGYKWRSNQDSPSEVCSHLNVQGQWCMTVSFGDQSAKAEKS